MMYALEYDKPVRKQGWVTAPVPLDASRVVSTSAQPTMTSAVCALVAASPRATLDPGDWRAGTQADGLRSWSLHYSGRIIARLRVVLAEVAP